MTTDTGHRTVTGPHIGAAAHTAGRAFEQLRAEWRARGPRGSTAKVLRAVASRISPLPDELDIAASDLVVLDPPRTTRPMRPDGPMSLGWVIGPPSAGSGGHTTLFRLIRGLEARGHSNVIHIRDRFCPGDVRTSRDIIEHHFEPMAARVVDVAELDSPSAPPFDALIATSWPTAYAVRRAATNAPRAYLVQDFEPWFHPAGSAASLAEATYRFGFHGICAGPWLARRLTSEYAMPADHFDFGVDTHIYGNRERPERNGVVFYARPCTPRRGFGLGLLALEELSERRPDIPIHLFGEDLAGMRPTFACTTHGALTPQQIDGLFNRCGAGLVLSFTNMSLLPFEMLAAGCIPVINDAPHNREILDTGTVRYADPTPGSLADALLAAIESPSRDLAARRAARSVAGLDWDSAVTQVERSLSSLTGLASVQGTSVGISEAV